MAQRMARKWVFMAKVRQEARRAAGEPRVLALDVGNTTTRLGVFEGGELAGTWELTTPARLTADEAFAQLKQALWMLGVEAGPAAAAPDGPGAPSTTTVPAASAIMACVVPSHAPSWKEALARLCASRPLVVGPGLKTGVRMRYDDPSEIGADRIADVVAARAAYGAPVVVVDLGTTTNFEVVDPDGSFAGGIIAPGMGLGADALADRAARLPKVELRAPASVVGKSTDAAMRSGLVLGEVARIGGLLDMIAAEAGPAPVVLTGEGAAELAALLGREATVDDTLTLRGLHAIWSLNRK